MSALFPVLEVPAVAPEVIEQLGSKPKFWLRRADDEQPWLFKFTRENTGEDWSEKIASEVARLLGVPGPQVELARFMEMRGCASRRFVEREKGFDLIHGSEVLAGRVLGYDKMKRWGQSDHNLKNILEAIENTFPPSERKQQLTTLAGFIVLDAVICNTDRHHDNWALLRGPAEQGKKVTHQMAPSFDHASSLGRELLDERRQAMLTQGVIERYAFKGHGGIYWQETDAKGENPVMLAMKAAHVHPEHFRPWLERIRQLRPEDFDGIVQQVPPEWMSLEARRFCVKLMSVTIEKLRTIQL